MDDSSFLNETHFSVAPNDFNAEANRFNPSLLGASLRDRREGTHSRFNDDERMVRALILRASRSERTTNYFYDLRSFSAKGLNRVSSSRRIRRCCSSVRRLRILNSVARLRRAALRR